MRTEWKRIVTEETKGVTLAHVAPPLVVSSTTPDAPAAIAVDAAP